MWYSMYDTNMSWVRNKAIEGNDTRDDLRGTTFVKKLVTSALQDGGMRQAHCRGSMQRREKKMAE